MILRGRAIAPGRASGRVLLSETPLSFLGGVDRTTGTVRDPRSAIRGRRIRGRVLAFPHGTGSTVGSYVLYGLARRGFGPSAIVVARADAIVASGAILAGIPTVDGIDLDVLAGGDSATVDGSSGTVTLVSVLERPVITAFLENRGRILFVRRSRRVGSFRGRWSGVSGYVEGSERPRDRARREIAEETGIRRARLVAAGRPLWTRHANVAYVVHPFLFQVGTRRVRLDWENVESRWLPARAVRTLRTVPRLPEVLESALHAAGRIA